MRFLVRTSLVRRRSATIINDRSLLSDLRVVFVVCGNVSDSVPAFLVSLQLFLTFCFMYGITMSLVASQWQVSLPRIPKGLWKCS